MPAACASGLRPQPRTPDFMAWNLCVLCSAGGGPAGGRPEPDAAAGLGAGCGAGRRCGLPLLVAQGCSMPDTCAILWSSGAAAKSATAGRQPPGGAAAGGPPATQAHCPRRPAHRHRLPATPLPSPPPAPPPAGGLASPDTDALLKQLKALQEQVALLDRIQNIRCASRAWPGCAGRAAPLPSACAAGRLQGRRMSW